MHLTAIYALLQWGHGDEAVEEVTNSKVLLTTTLLQWGHGDEAVEEMATQRSFETPVQLQWGHGDEAVEEGKHPRKPRSRESSFNGATAMKPGGWGILPQPPMQDLIKQKALAQTLPQSRKAI